MAKSNLARTVGVLDRRHMSNATYGEVASVRLRGEPQHQPGALAIAFVGVLVWGASLLYHALSRRAARGRTTASPG